MLIPFDDYPVHQNPLPLAQAGGGHPDFYDRFWFNGYCEDTYFGVAMGSYPGRGVMDAAFSVVSDGVQRSVFVSGRAPVDRSQTSIGPMSIELVEPMRVNRLRVNAPEQGLVADLTFTARTPVCEEVRHSRWGDDRLLMDMTRATVLGWWTGTLEVAGKRIELPERMYGTKDRSWGVRPIADPATLAPRKQMPQLFVLWSPLHFEDRALHYMLFEDAKGVPWARTCAVLPILADGESVMDGSGIEHVSLRHVLRWAEGRRRSEGATFLLDRPGEQTEKVELEPLLTFRMRGIGYGHPEFPHGRWHDELRVAGEEHKVEELDKMEIDKIHVQQVVRARWGDRVGLGVLEQLVFGPHEPSGFTKFLDGAVAGAMSGRA